MAPPDSSPWSPDGRLGSASSRARRRSLARLSGFGCREWLPGSTSEFLAPVASSSCFSWSGSEATTTCLLARATASDVLASVLMMLAPDLIPTGPVHWWPYTIQWNQYIMHIIHTKFDILLLSLGFMISWWPTMHHHIKAYHHTHHAYWYWAFVWTMCFSWWCHMLFQWWPWTIISNLSLSSILNLTYWYWVLAWVICCFSDDHKPSYQTYSYHPY